MSIKSFHIVFTVSVAMLMLFLSVWNINNWIEYRSAGSLFYSILSASFIVIIYRYGKFFINKVVDLD